MAARSVLSKSYPLLTWEAAANGSKGEKVRKLIEGGRKKVSWWVPHQRTGIYYPQGEEWVMDDVPETAATFTSTCWIRDTEVDKPSANAS